MMMNTEKQKSNLVKIRNKKFGAYTTVLKQRMTPSENT